MKTFSGSFYPVTLWSLYKITIPPDLKSRPTVEKRATKSLSADLGRDLMVPVGGRFIRGFYLGITRRGLFQYHASFMNDGLVEGRPPCFEDVMPRSICAKNVTRTHGIVGMFLKHSDAENCYSDQAPQVNFDPKWAHYTREVLAMIGLDHPLITISQGNPRYAVPKDLLPT